MRTRTCARLAAWAVGALAALTAGACTTSPIGQDQAVTVNGGPLGPIGWSSVSWRAIGAEAVTGPTTVTLTVLSGPMVLGGAQYFDPDPTYANTGYGVSEDGRTVTLTFDGTLAPERGHFFKYQYGGLVAPGGGRLRATISNANDSNAVNDVAEVEYTAAGPYPS